MPIRPPAGSHESVLPESWVWDELAKRQEELPPKDIMFLAMKNETRYQFMHIPKTAGTAIEHAGKLAGQLWGKQTEGRYHGMPTMPDGNRCSSWHIPAQTLDVLQLKNPYVDALGVFCVSRHPYNRFVSEYTYRVSLGTFGHGDHLCSEEALNDYLKKSVLDVLEGRRWIHDCHFLPQSEFIWDFTTGRQWCLDVLRFDNLPSEMEALMVKWNLPVTLAAEKYNPSKAQCPGLSTLNLTMETRIMIATAYWEDFEVLQYDPTLLY